MKAYFAAGCFWGIEEQYRITSGVIRTSVGYANGHVKNPSYELVCGGQTNHAETVEVEFDDKLVEYDALLDMFWKLHNPTTLNRQGLDIGSQYRSGIYYINPEQKEIALKQKNELIKRGMPIVTEIEALQIYFLAEEYHQQYQLKNKRF